MPHTPAPALAPHAFVDRSPPLDLQGPPQHGADVSTTREREIWRGRYAIGAELGEGTSGRVHEALDLLLGRTVAIKLLHTATLPPARLLESEARALATVEHPAVVRVYSVYPNASPPFLVMERALGRSLRAILRDGPMPIATTLGLLKQIAAGIDALHAAGIVHGDVKPANVIVDDRGMAKLVDVGLTPYFETGSPGAMFGTPAYMAPERVLGLDARALGLEGRSDVYAFAVTCFEMLTGQLPFPDAFVGRVLSAQAFEDPPVPSAIAQLSTSFDAPLAHGLAKRPQERPATCSELFRALELASTGCDAQGRPLRVIIADDDPDQRELVTMILEMHLRGARVVACATGQDVLDAITTEAPALCVLDLSMPEPGGIELVRQVRALAPSTAIVIVTGGGSGIERRATRELRVRRFLVKPVEVDELVVAVREALSLEGPAALPMLAG